MPTDKAVISFEFPDLDKWVDRSHILLFEGFILPWSLGNKVKEIPINMWKEDLRPLGPLAARREMVIAPYHLFEKIRPGDINFSDSEVQNFRYEHRGHIVQEVPLHLVIVPKSDARFLFLTYKESSLEPVYKTVRVLEKELCIETATK